VIERGHGTTSQSSSPTGRLPWLHALRRCNQRPSAAICVILVGVGDLLGRGEGMLTVQWYYCIPAGRHGPNPHLDPQTALSQEVCDKMKVGSLVVHVGIPGLNGMAGPNPQLGPLENVVLGATPLLGTCMRTGISLFSPNTQRTICRSPLEWSHPHHAKASCY
jgi:hypothetical protein